MSKQVARKPAEEAEKSGGALAAYDYGQLAGSGFENQTREDYSIPFLALMQGISPQLDVIEGAKPGVIFNTVTNDLFKADVGVCFVPCTTEHCYVEWVPRKDGGGFVGVHALDSEVVKNARAEQEFGMFKMENGNDLIETFYVYGIVVDDQTGAATPAVIAFTSTKIKKYKGWMTKAKSIQIRLPDGRNIPAPLPAHKYRLRSVKEKNNKGEFWNWNISFDAATAPECRLAPSDELFQLAISTQQLVISGKARAAYESQGGSGVDEEGGKKGGAPF